MDKILNLLLLFVTLTIGNRYVVYGQETKSFSFKPTSNSGGTLSGAPHGVTAKYYKTCYNKPEQVTGNNQLTLTFNGLTEGISITGVKLKVHNNATAGDGRATIKLGAKTLGSLRINGLGNTSVVKDVTPFTNGIVAQGENLVVTIKATTNSVYCELFEIFYQETSSSKIKTSLSFADPKDRAYEINVMRGKTFSNVATLTPVIKGAVINYSSSDKNVADINEKGDVKINGVGKARITASFAGNDTCLASTVSYVITVEDYTLKARWIRTRLQSLKPTDRFVIVDVSAKRAMSNKEVTQQAPKAVPITTDEKNSELTCDVADSLVWNVSCKKMRYTFYPDGQTVNHLYSNSYGKNDCLRISSLDHDLSFPFCEKNGYSGLSIMYEHTYYIYVSEDKKFWKAYKTIPDPITSIAYYKRYAVDENGKVPTTIAFDKGDTIIYEKCTVGTMAEYTNKARVLTSDGHVLLTDAKVTYTVSSDNAKVADGQVNVDATKLATYTITASYVGNETFAPSTASYTITVGRVVIDQTKDKKTFSAGNDVTVTVKRTFNDNAWNTLVLPFDLTEEQIKEAFGKDVVVASYTGATRNADNTFTLNFTETKTIIANVPVFIYGVQAREEGYTFTGVDIKDAVPTQTADGFNFVGTYMSSQVPVGNYFVNSKNKFYRAGDNKTLIYGTRATFEPASNVSEAKGLGFNIKNDGTTTDISTICAGCASLSTSPIFNLSGLPVGKAYKGIVIRKGKTYLKK